MNYKRGLGIGLVFIGLFIILTGKVITGAVIGFQPENYLSLIGIIVFVIGIILLFTSTLGYKSRIAELIRDYESGKLNPVEVALKVNELLQITGVDYRGRDKETIRTQEGYFPVRLRDSEKARDLALALYEIALVNDRRNARNCELHLGKKASSKHHREGLEKVIRDFEKRHEKSLSLVRT